MRAIDGEYLLYGMATFSERENGAEFMKGVDAAAAMIVSAETIEPPANWTPCSEGLPERGVCVLGYLRTREMKNDTMFIVCKYDESEDDDCFFDRDGFREDILAWQPLPEPYRGEA